MASFEKRSDTCRIRVSCGYDFAGKKTIESTINRMRRYTAYTAVPAPSPAFSCDMPIIRFYPVYSSHRKTAEIAVVAPGEVVVTAPAEKSDDELISVVSRKALWITQQLFKLKDVRFQPVVRELVNGESLLYLGRNYRLNLVLDEKLRKPSIMLLHGVFQIRTKSMEHEYLRPHLVNWYRVKAAQRINARIAYFAPKLGVEPKVVRIKEQEKRWGSCARDGTLYFNWRGVLAPAHILDYIVAHEICHLVEQQHSSRFWGLLRVIMPDYEIRKKWLADNGVKLDI